MRRSFGAIGLQPVSGQEAGGILIAANICAYVFGRTKIL
jgi:hypothetical protein